jgi:hypothetical protein
MKIDFNGPLAASALSVAADLLLQRFGPLKDGDSPEAIASRIVAIGTTAEALIRSFVVAVEKSPRPKKR